MLRPLFNVTELVCKLHVSLVRIDERDVVGNSAYITRTGSPFIPVIDPCADTKFQEEPRQRGRKIHGWWENLRFLT